MHGLHFISNTVALLHCVFEGLDLSGWYDTEVCPLQVLLPFRSRALSVRAPSTTCTIYLEVRQLYTGSSQFQCVVFPQLLHSAIGLRLKGRNQYLLGVPRHVKNSGSMRTLTDFQWTMNFILGLLFWSGWTRKSMKLWPWHCGVTLPSWQKISRKSATYKLAQWSRKETTNGPLQANFVR